MITTFSVGVDDTVSVVTIARAERANALDAAHWQDLADGVTRVVADGARAVVITGEGRNFCAGGDLDEIDYEALLVNCESAMQAISTAAVPIIAHVNGPAIGAGLQLAVACDLRVAEPTARFAIPAAAISKPAHPTLIRRIVALVGVGAARALLLGGEDLSVTRAQELGLVQRQGDLSASLDWARTIAGYAPLVVSYFKAELGIDDEAGSGRYNVFMDGLLGSQDFGEAALAHREGRRPIFVGR